MFYSVEVLIRALGVQPGKALNQVLSMVTE
jgi:hypothetical protein